MRRQLICLALPIVERFPALLMIYRYIKYVSQILKGPKETPFGFKLLGDRGMQQGEFEPEETQVVMRILRNVDVFINVGAHIGYYCCLALSSGKNVVAFEPIALNLRYLLRNVKANKLEAEIEVFPLALSNKVGIIEIYGGGAQASLVKGWAGTPERYITLVPASTMDRVLGFRFQGKKCFILVDIEGAEKFMLEGASFFLNADPKPTWMIEISIAEHQPKGISINPHLLSTFAIFWDRGYEAWTADKQCRLIQVDEVENIVRSGENTLLTHNFLFIDKGRKSEILDA